MPCYVDELFVAESRNPVAFRVGARNGHQWCHLWADTREELTAMAARIGQKPSWAQVSTSGIHHYDLTPNKRSEAIAAGAIEQDFKIWLRKRKSK